SLIEHNENSPQQVYSQCPIKKGTGIEQCFKITTMCRGDEQNLSQLMHHSEGSYVRSFQKFFMNLPLACLVGRDILAVHGGISPKLRSLQDIREIARPIDEFMKGTLACDLDWSHPDTLNKVAEFEQNFEREATVGIGQLFSQSAVKDACRRLKVKMIIRGH
ncbi:hypothetical protein COOONC_24841, partial [Cooperia oncophora]